MTKGSGSHGTDTPIRVAIVGGGCAGLAAAFELSRPEHQGRYRVTVYQQGWRLGGKGASGRGPSGRIEEHGLHLWLGYYENAFRLVRECYEELRRDPARIPIATWEDAFSPVRSIGVMDPDAGGWEAWLAHFPTNGASPGDRATAPLYEPRDYVARLLGLASTLIGSLSKQASGNVSATIVAGVAAVTGHAADVARALMAKTPLDGAPEMRRVLDSVEHTVRVVLEPMARTNPAVRRAWEMIEVVLGNTRGILADRLLANPRGFDAINHLDYREWLAGHGVSEPARSSSVVRGLYDLCFAYENGDGARPRFAAGQALRCALRAFFTYRGAVFWRLNAGMGDVVFAPLLQMLDRRDPSVEFRFFHRLAHVAIGEDPSPHVASLTFDVQGTPRNEYAPLIDVQGLPSWPSEPLYAQLVEGVDMQRARPDLESQDDPWCVGTTRLEVGRDFDFVVLAVGLPVVPRVCEELLARDARWRKMVETVKTVATRSVQVWLREPLGTLGWNGGAAVSGFREPFDTCADMSHILPLEAWRDPPAGLAYLCSVIPDDEDATDARVRQAATTFLEQDLVHLLPGAVDSDGRFRWELLASPENGQAPHDPEALATQYWRANSRASERYVLSLPGTIECRISPLDPTYDNLTVAGDWTDCGFNCGCVEAAVMSGRLAAHALSGAPSLDAITGFDHP